VCQSGVVVFADKETGLKKQDLLRFSPLVTVRLRDNCLKESCPVRDNDQGLPLVKVDVCVGLSGFAGVNSYSVSATRRIS
jgi:hypothetical protein